MKIKYLIKIFENNKQFLSNSDINDEGFLAITSNITNLTSLINAKFDFKLNKLIIIFLK